MNSVGRMLGTATSYIAPQTSEALSQDRSFATVHLATAGLKTTIGMNK